MDQSKSLDASQRDGGSIQPAIASLFCPEALKCMARISSLADCTIVTADGTEFSISKELLGAHSEVLGNMFADLDADQCRVTVAETTEEFAGLLNHAYGSDMFHISAENINLTLKLAAKYDMPGLHRACVKDIAKVELTIESLPGWINTASAYDIPELLEYCKDFAARHLQQIIADRSNNGKPPTAWLNTLPAPTLTSIMLKRSRILAGWVRSPGVPRGQVSANAVAYTDAELEELKSKQPET